MDGVDELFAASRAIDGMASKLRWLWCGKKCACHYVWSCHLASCHTCTRAILLLQRNLTLNSIHKFETLLNFSHGCTHMFYDLVKIHITLMRDITLQISMKHTKHYLLVYLKARRCPGLSVNYWKFKCIVVPQVNVD